MPSTTKQLKFKICDSQKKPKILDLKLYCEGEKIPYYKSEIIIGNEILTEADKADYEMICQVEIDQDESEKEYQLFIEMTDEGNCKGGKIIQITG